MQLSPESIIQCRAATSAEPCAYEIEYRLSQYSIEPVTLRTSERLQSYFGAFLIADTRVEIMGALQVSNVQMQSGQFENNNQVVRVESGPFLQNVREVRNLLVSLYEDRPVYLRDVAQVVDGPEEIRSYSFFGFGPGK